MHKPDWLVPTVRRSRRPANRSEEQNNWSATLRYYLLMNGEAGNGQMLRCGKNVISY